MNHIAGRDTIDPQMLLAMRDVLAAHAAQIDREARFPAENMDALRSSGLLALTVPNRYGGLGGGLRDTCRMLGTLAEGCASTAVIVAMQAFKMAALTRGDVWAEPVQARIAADAVAAGALINALRVEPELGSPTRGGLPATSLRRVTRGWTLSGHKIFATGAPGLGWMDVWARHEDQVGHALVRADAPGIRIVETWDHIGMRGTCSHDVIFSDVPVEQDHVALRPPEAWAGTDPAQMAWNAAGLGAIYTGIARAARNWAISFLRQRTPTGLGAPLATLPRVQEKMGEVEMLLITNDRLIASAAMETDLGVPTQAAVAGLLKTMLIENAVRVVELAASLAGNHAHVRRNAMERYIRDVRSGRVQAPQADAVFVAAGKGLLA